MRKIVVTTASFGKYNPEIIHFLEKKRCAVRKVVPFDKDKFMSEIEDADALIVGLEKVDAEALHRAQKLRLIAKHGVGVDNIDLATCKKLGIAVANSPGTNTQAVADLTFGLMLGLARSIPSAHFSTQNGRWLRYDGFSVWQKTLGIIGLGAIGRAVAKRARGFDMRMIGYDVTAPTIEEKELGVKRCPLEKLLVESDFITLHVPFLPGTKGMIGEKQIQLMKSAAFIINTSRGGIIDEQALYEALRDKRIAGAGLDTFAVEPPINSPLLHLDNVITTPHMGAFTIEANILTSEFTANNVLHALEGKKVLNLVH